MQPRYKRSATQQTVKKITRENIQAGFSVQKLIEKLEFEKPDVKRKNV